MPEKEFQVTTANTTVSSNAGDVILAAAASKGIYSTVGGTVVSSTVSGDQFLKSHAAYALSGVHRKTFVVSTTDTTTTPIISIACPVGYACAISAFIMGVQSDASDATAGRALGIVTNAAGTTAAKGTASITVVESDSATNITFTADDTNDAALVNVVGPAENWAWQVAVEWMYLKTAA